MIDETLDAAAMDLAEARAKIEAAREALLKAGGEGEAVRAALARLEQTEAEVGRVEGAVARGGVEV